jgi:hypothetical protein
MTAPGRRFERGQRVELSPKAKQVHLYAWHGSERRGTVTGYGRDPELVYVCWDGRITPDRLHEDFVVGAL